MRTQATAFSLALSLVAAGALAAEDTPKTWVDHVRFHTLRTLKSLGRDIDGVATSMRKTLTGLKDDTAAGLASVTREGRRGLESASRNVAQATASTTRATHDTFLNVARTVSPGVASATQAKRFTSARKLESPLLAPHFLRGNDITLAWHLKTGGQPVRAALVLDDRLLVETEGQDLYSFEPRSGVLQWLYALAGPSQSGYSADPDAVLFIAKDIYYELDRTIGRPRRRIVLQFPASNPPTVLGKVVMINSWERRVYALDRETRSVEWTYMPGDNTVGALAVTPDLIYVADIAGNLVCYSVPERDEKWTYKAHDAFRVTPVLAGDNVIAPAEDVFVHAVNRFGGLRSWKYPVQGRVTRPVWVEGDTVYFAADGDAFYAVSAAEGKLRWRCPNGGWPVAIGRANLYIQGANREIWCLDRKTGEKRWSVSAEPFVYFVHNTTSDHIFLATEEGEIYAFYLRGDHIEKEAAPAPAPKAKAKAVGIEEPEPGAGEAVTPPGAPAKPKTRPFVPRKKAVAPKAEEGAKEAEPEDAPAKKKAKAAVKEEAEPAKAKEAEEEAPEKGAKAKVPAKAEGWKSKEAPKGELPPGAVEEEEDKTGDATKGKKAVEEETKKEETPKGKAAEEEEKK
jgi:outer membrane protein assembly factor BamB